MRCLPINFSVTLGSGLLTGILRYEENLDLKADSVREGWRRGEGREFNKSELIKRGEKSILGVCVCVSQCVTVRGSTV